MARLQVFRFLYQIWRRPDSDNLYAPRLKSLYRKLSFFPVIFGIMGLLWLSFTSPKLTSTFRIWALELSAPFLKGVSAINYAFTVSFPNFISDWIQAYHLVKKHQAQEQEALFLTQRVIFLEGEIAALQKLLKTSFLTPTVLTTAVVVGFTQDALGRMLLIHYSKDQKVMKNMPVITSEGLLGKIFEAGPSTARVLSLFSANFKVPIVIGTKAYTAIAAGQSKERMRILYLSNPSDIHSGDIASTSGQGGVFPAGIPLGTVHCENAEWFVIPFVKFQSLRFVKILQGSYPTTEEASIEGSLP